MFCVKNALYGLKQFPGGWFGRLTKSMKAFGYRASNSDHTLFSKREKGRITENDQDEIFSLQQYLAFEFE